MESGGDRRDERGPVMRIVEQGEKKGIACIPAVISISFIFFFLFGSACSDGEKVIVHKGELVALQFEHRQVVEHPSGEDMKISLLVTKGRIRGAIPHDGVKLHYSVDGNKFESLVMMKTASGRRFVGVIPRREGWRKVNYYIEVTHRTGKTLTFPKDAGPDNCFTVRIE